MTKHNRDYRTTRHGRGLDLDKPYDNVIGEEIRYCPGCSRNTNQQKITLIEKGRPGYRFRCSDCGLKTFGGWDDQRGDPELNASSDQIQKMNNELWEWVMENIDAALEYSPPYKIHIFVGKIGHRVRHKGKPAFSNSVLAPELLEFMRTPLSIKRLGEALARLRHKDEYLYYFIVLRGMGYSYAQMDDLEYFPYVFTRRGKNRLGHSTLEVAESGRSFNRRAIDFLFNCLTERDIASLTPQHRLNLFVNSNAKQKGRDKRVICPRCSGTDSKCTLCRTRNQKWDGTVPQFMADMYRTKIADGTWRE